MGFDVYGLEPKINTAEPEILNKNWSEFSEEEQELYWKEKNKYEKENPGIYFRNSVWWWRPLWEYVCEVCEDVMSPEDVGAGGDNSGSEIVENTVQRMVDKLIIEIALGNHIKYQKELEKKIRKMPDEECFLCEGTGIRTDEHTNYKSIECGSCSGKGTKRPFITNYPFHHKNLEEFVEFLSESGGIKIC